MNKPQTVDAQFKLRLPTTLKLKIENEAQGLKRSMNAEIVARLEKSFNFKKLDNNSVLNQYQLIDRKKELSNRLTKAIELFNSLQVKEIKYRDGPTCLNN